MRDDQRPSVSTTFASVLTHGVAPLSYWASTMSCDPAGGPSGPNPPDRLCFSDLWDCFHRLKAGPGGVNRLLEQVDPAVIFVRRQVLQDCLKGLIRKSPSFRALGIEHKKVLGQRLSNVVWKGYLLGLAFQELVYPGAPRGRLVDRAYMTGLFRRLMDGRSEPSASVSGLDQSVVRALAEIQNLESMRLEDQMVAAGAGAIVGPKGDLPLLRSAVGGLALMGFMIWVAQRKALGQITTLD